MVEVKTVHTMSSADLLRRLGLNLYQSQMTKIDQIVIEEGTIKIYTTRTVKHQPPRQKEAAIARKTPEGDNTAMESAT
jgi:hypothetical protein